MKTLYLHIGTPKTATSSIQTFCRINRQQLRQYGYSFPIMPFSYPHVRSSRNAYFLTGSRGGSRRELTPEEEAFYQNRLTEGLTVVHDKFELYDNVILSDEHLWWAVNYAQWNPIQILQEDAIASGYTVKVIVYLRRQDAFLISRWNQLVKAGRMETKCEESIAHTFSINPLLTDYAATLDVIANIISKENIIVRRFDPASWVEHSIYSDFLNAVGLDAHLPLQIPEQDVNLRLNDNYTEIRRVINDTPDLSASERGYLGSLVRKTSDEHQASYNYSMLSVNETAKLLDHCKESNERVANEYIGDGKPLFSEEIKDLPKWKPNNEYMSEDIIRYFTAVTSELHRENEQLREEIANQKKEITNLRRETKALRDDAQALKQKLKHPVRAVGNRLKPGPTDTDKK